MAKYYPVGGQQYVLGSSIGSTDSSILLSSFLEPVTGTPLTMTNMNTDIAFGTIAPKTTSSEFISFTGVTQNANGSALLTGVTRGLAKKYPLTSDAAYKLPHSGQAIFILSDAPQVFQEYVSIVNDQTVGGIKTFSSSPVVPDPTLGTQAANKEYVDSAISGGVGTATNTSFGTVKLSVAAASVPNPIAVGDNDPRVPTAGQAAALPGNNTDIAVGSGNKFVTQTGLQHNAEKYAADAGSTDTYVITLSPAPTSYTNGMVVYFKANTINTGAATLNVNGLGAKTIVKGVNTTLADGDIAAGMLCTLIYDGTNFVLQNPVASILGQGNSFVGAVTSTGNLSTNQNIDTTFTCNFLAKTITLYFLIKGTDSSGDKFTQGVATFSGTTLTGVMKFLDEAPGGNFTSSTFSIGSTALIAGSTSNANSRAITITINSISTTQFVVRCACVGTDTVLANATFYPVALQ